MQFRYGEYEGDPFPTPDSLFPSPKVVRFILQYGQQALDSMEQSEDEQLAQMVQEMLDAGLLERDANTGELKLTPRMVRGIQHRSLLEIFQGLRRGSRDGHGAYDAGRSDERSDGTRPYEFGDAISELDTHATMRNALARQVKDEGWREGQGDMPHATLPIQLNVSDFELHETESRTDVATCILLDMSGSMMRYGRFFQAKRVALGMASLIRQQFPLDTVDYVGFYSTACRVRESDLPLLMPKPVSLYDPAVNLHLPLEQALKNPRRVPQHFTNLQLGLRMARQILSRRGAANKQIFIITDGQPTAHVASDPIQGEVLHLIYPPRQETAIFTMQEAMRCQQQSIRLATFALIEDYYGMEWVDFVDQLTRLTRGTAFYCSSDDLSSTVIESYLSGKRRKRVVK